MKTIQATQRRDNMAKSQQTQEYKSAVKNLLDAVDRVADELIAGRTDWYEKDAVKVVLLDYLEGMLSDNHHDDPSWYADIVEYTLSEKPVNLA
jgi:hypothetical protein